MKWQVQWPIEHRTRARTSKAPAASASSRSLVEGVATQGVQQERGACFSSAGLNAVGVFPLLSLFSVSRVRSASIRAYPECVM